MELLTPVIEFLINGISSVWNSMSSGWGFIGSLLIVFIVLSRVLAFFKKIIKKV